MKIIEREHIDTLRWDALVKSQKDHSFFSLSWYLDATASNWCILTDDYSFGIALPYTDKLGVRSLYTPIFVRYMHWFGDTSKKASAMRIIQDTFNSWNLQIESKCMLDKGCEEFVYQTVKSGKERVLGSQAKRMLKKAEKNGFEVKKTNDFEFAFRLVSKELTGKHEGLTAESMTSFKDLLANAKENSVLQVYYIDDEASVICLEDENQTLYLKGTATKKMKDAGAYYLLMNTIIENTIQSNKRFDFGGSRVEGVRRFNLNLGGMDNSYYHCVKDALPLWYKLAKGIKKKWKK